MNEFQLRTVLCLIYTRNFIFSIFWMHLLILLSVIISMEHRLKVMSIKSYWIGFSDADVMICVDHSNPLLLEKRL